MTHPWRERLDASQIATEFWEDRKAPEDIVGYPVRGMAYPFGPYDARVIETLRGPGVVYGRTTENAADCFPPAEPLARAGAAHQYASNPSVPERFAQRHDNARYSGVTLNLDGKWVDVPAGELVRLG